MAGQPQLSSAAAVARFRRILAATHLPRRPAYVPHRIDDPKYVRLFDETLCDMEQSPGAAMTIADILLIARKLALLGVDIIAAGSPAFSPEAFDIVRSIATEIGNTPVGEGGHVPVICGLARCSKEEINRVWDAVKPAQLPRINMLFPTSEILEEWMTPDQLAAMAGKMVAYARGLGCHDVQFSVEAGRSDKESLYRILEEVIKAGATTINIVDTAVHTLPPVFGKLIGDIKANIPGIENVIISTQCQNCRGLTTANTIAGAIAGARQLQVAISGNGERARNASVEEVVEAIECNSRRYLGGLYTSTNSKRINTTKKMIQEYIGISIQPHIHKVDSSSTMNDSDLKKKGFLSFTNALVCTLSLFCAALCVYSNNYPGSAKALVSYDETWVKVISIANVALCSGSLVMIPFASHFKDGESIDNVGFSIFLLVLYLWMILFTIAWCATLCAFLQVPFWEAVLPLGVVLFFFVVLPLIVYFERQRPTITKLGKNLREKLKNCYVRLPPLPGFFKQALEFCGNKLRIRRTSVMEDVNSLPSFTSHPKKEPEGA